MDNIDKCIARGMHITKNLIFVGKTWQDFEIACQGKKLILYGIGNLITFFAIRCKAKVYAAVDNDVEKQGCRLSDFVDFESENIIIESSETLKRYNPAETVILISSQRYYEEIAASLEKQNFYNYFSILNLEYNYRQYMKQNNLPFETEEDFVQNYAKECAEKYPVQINKIVVCGMVNVIFSGHEKYIVEQLLSINKNLDIVWLTDKPNVYITKGVRTIYKGHLRQYIYEMETAKIWLYSIPIRIKLIKRENQIYIQLKHWSSITLKRFYLNDFLSKTFDEDILKLNGKWIDYIVTGSAFDEDSCRSGFNFNGKFLRFGSPRSDILFKKDKYKTKVYNQFNLNLDEYILLYAPTFRTNMNTNQRYFQSYALNFKMLLESLNHKFKNKWKIFLRLHPSVINYSKKFKLSNDIIDVSNYDDGQELVAVSDIMITDYSSIMFEFAYVKRPVFLYAPDRDKYIQNEREFLIDYDSLPFSISTTNEELSQQIKIFDENQYVKDIKSFLDKYNVHEDGRASERTAKFIVKLLDGG